MPEKSLKDEIRMLLRGYLGIQFLVLFAVLSVAPLEVKSLKAFIAEPVRLMQAGTMAFIALTIGAYVMSSMMSRVQKAKLVFWRINNPMPASRAFTEIAKNDPRVNFQSLESKYGPLPTDPEEQNSLWYDLYKPLRDKVTIRDAHKSFLLLRDLSVFTLFFGVLGSIALAWWLGDAGLTIKYFAAQVVALFIVTFAAQRAGIAMVENVLAEVSSFEAEKINNQSEPKIKGL